MASYFGLVFIIKKVIIFVLLFLCFVLLLFRWLHPDSEYLDVEPKKSCC